MYLLFLVALIRPLIEGQSEASPLLQEITLPTNLNENQTVKLNCDLLQGGGQVEFVWLFNNEKLVESSRKRIKSNDEFSYLVIKSLSVDDIGRYTCIARSSENESDRKDVDVIFNG